MTGDSGSTRASFSFALARRESLSPVRAFRVALLTEEWIPPQRPLSDEITIKSLLGVGLSDGTCSKTSVSSGGN